MSDALVMQVAARLDRLVPRDATVLVAVSGGGDSLALLDLLHQGAARHGRDLRVVHVDHGIHPESAGIARTVGVAATERGLPFDVVTLALPPDCSETRARVARRRAMRALLARYAPAVVALGHHADDQVETVLLRVLKGSGPAGLAGMAARRGPWIRPLLGVRRSELVAYATSRGLSTWQDPANADPRHLRSWLRGVALPLLRERLPDVDDRLAAVGLQAGQLRQGLNAVPESLESLEFREESDGFSVAAPGLMGYRSGLRSVVIAALGRRCGVPIGRVRRAAILALLRGGRSGASVQLSSALEVELAFGRLHFRRSAGEPLPTVPLPASGEVRIGAFRLRVTPGSAEGPLERAAPSTWLAEGEYRVRGPLAGDRIVPIGGTGRRSIRVLLREARVPAGRRRSWPMIVSATDPATVVWVPGICRSAANVPVAGEEALHVACDDP